MYRRRDLYDWAKEACSRGEKFFYCDPKYIYKTGLEFDPGIYEDWIEGSYTKVVYGAKNKDKLLRAAEKAKELGMEENIDYFLIYDSCRTELESEEEDGSTLTCIGFIPMDSSNINKITKSFHLY